MNEIHPRFGQAMTAAQYSSEWERSAAAFSAAGHYTWMNERLGKADKIIEVGCGAGASTEALLSTGRQVLVIESNQSCADRTCERLNAKGISVELISVDQLSNLSAWQGLKVKIVVIDVLSSDLELHLQPGSFDALVCWMTGTHPHHISEILSKPYMSLEGGDMALYRSLVQERCYKLGNHAVKVGGGVHMVDRAMVRSWSDKDWMREELVTLLSTVAGPNYVLTKGDCYLRRLSEGLNQSAIKYVAQHPASVTGEVVLTSTVAHLA